MYRTQILAQSVRATADTAPAARAAARRILMDTIGAAVAGASTQSGRAALVAATRSWGSGGSDVWFSAQQLTAPGAAFVNSAYASTLDLDDGHRGAAGHPAAAIVPAVLASITEQDTEPRRLLNALVIGYDVAVRVSASRDINSIRTTDTGQWCGYGVAAAIGWLKGLSEQTIAHAMAIAGHTASSQAATGWTKLGHSVKEGIPFATAAAIAAIELAQAGYTGPLDLLDDQTCYDQRKLVSDFGRPWQIEKGYLKIYSACRWAHAPIDAALRLVEENAIDPKAIDHMEISVFSRALTLLNEPRPQTIDAAQYSIPFSVALALTHGPKALLPVTESYLGDHEVHSLASRIVVSHDASMDALFPAMTPASVSIRKGTDTFSLYLDAPKGDATNPLSDEELMRKFHWLVNDKLGSQEARRLERELLFLEDESEAAGLCKALKTQLQTVRKIGEPVR